MPFSHVWEVLLDPSTFTNKKYSDRKSETELSSLDEAGCCELLALPSCLEAASRSATGECP